MNMDVSVVMPAHAKPQRLRLTLAGLVAEREDWCELIVVADGARPETLAVLEEFKENILVIRTPGLGRAGARNSGAKAARGEILVFVDDDILVGAGFVAAHRHGQSERPGLVHGRIRELIGLLRIEDPTQGGPGCPPIDLALVRAGRWRPDGARLFRTALEAAAERVHAGDLNVDAPWLAGAGANISIRRADWLRVGGFDEHYGTGWGLEDLDFAFRLFQAGVPISLAPEARGYHMSHHNPTRWAEQDTNFRILQAKTSAPEVLALGALLAQNGSADAYELAVRQIRMEARSTEPA